MSSQSAAGSSGPQRFGNYELLAPLASGGTAEVFLARILGEAGFEKIVVVKRLLDHLADDSEFVDMFLDEARLGSVLDNSNIVQTLELGKVEGRYFIAMEYLAGFSLAALAKKSQERLPDGLPVEITLGIIMQACHGLHYAHEATQANGEPLRIVHRDISPQNLIVTFEGVLKVVDFGIAHAAESARAAHTKSGFIKGEFAYMSPEQCLGKPLDRRCDVFALGIIAHELLCGHRLFKRGSTYDTYQAIVNGEVPRPSQVSRRLDGAIDELVLRALRPRVEDRYPTAEAFGEAVQEVLHRRGKHGSAGDISRYLEKYFQEEIDAHSARMGGIVEGGASAAAELESAWDGDEIGLEEDVDQGESTNVTAPPIEPPTSSPPEPRPAAPARPPASTPAPTVGLRVTPQSVPVPPRRTPPAMPVPPVPPVPSGIPQMMAPIESGATTGTHARDDAGATSSGATSSDAAQLHAERSAARPAVPAWVLALIFIAAVGITVAVVLAVM